MSESSEPQKMNAPKPKRKPKKSPANKAIESAPENKTMDGAPENKATGGEQ